VKRNEVMQIRVSAEEKAAIEKAAAEQHMTAAEYLRSCALPSKSRS
jgi:uncharacterized protein (DUF1778 family)